MRKIGKVKYNGKSTADLGVIVSGEASFDAAAPDYTSYQIPGKNGDFMLSNNRFLNIDVTYPAFIPADFEEKVQAIRSWMRSARSYARIEDNYDLLHFRMGMGKDVLTFEPSAENVGSNMSLVFDCKPQRFLYSGEEENQIGVWGPVQTASGDMVTFEDDENGAFKSISASITPTQNLNGYDYPWPSGGGPEGAPESNICPIAGKTEAIVYKAGKNILNNNITSRVVNGITFTVNEDKTVTANGTATAEALFSIPVPDIDGDFFFSGCPVGGGSGRYDVFAYDTTARARYKRWDGVTPSASDFGPYTMQEVQLVKGHSGQIRVRISEGYTVDNVIFKPMLVLRNTTDGSYAPYIGSTNRISWQTEAGEVYGGTVDVVSGLLTVDRAYVSTTWGALLNETTVGTMIRRRCRLGDNVAISGKASISNIAVFNPRSFNTDYGARWMYDSSNAYFYLPPDTSDSQEIAFVYFLATPQTYQLTGQQIKTLLGLNNVWADSGTVTAEWGEDPFGLYNPTLFDALPLIKVKNPQNGCAVTVNGTTMTCSRRYTGTVTIDCELMDVYSVGTNLNADWSKDFPKLSPGENSVAFSGADAVTIIPRWWEL